MSLDRLLDELASAGGGLDLAAGRVEVVGDAPGDLIDRLRPHREELAERLHHLEREIAVMVDDLAWERDWLAVRGLLLPGDGRPSTCGTTSLASVDTAACWPLGRRSAGTGEPRSTARCWPCPTRRRSPASHDPIARRLRHDEDHDDDVAEDHEDEEHQEGRTMSATDRVNVEHVALFGHRTIEDAVPESTFSKDTTTGRMVRQGRQMVEASHQA